MDDDALSFYLNYIEREYLSKADIDVDNLWAQCYNAVEEEMIKRGLL
jgi:hypothetical protein